MSTAQNGQRAGSFALSFNSLVVPKRFQPSCDVTVAWKIDGVEKMARIR